MDKEKVVDTFLKYLEKVKDEDGLVFQNYHAVKNYFCAASEPDENNKVQVFTLALHCGAVHRTEHDVSNSATCNPILDAFEQGLDEFYAEDVYLDLKNKTHLDLTEETGITKETHIDEALDCFDNIVSQYFVKKEELLNSRQFAFGREVVFATNIVPHFIVLVSEKNPEGLVRTLIYNMKSAYVRMVEHQQLEPYRGLSSKSVEGAVIHSLERLRTQQGYEDVTEKVGITYDMLFAGTFMDVTRPSSLL